MNLSRTMSCLLAIGIAVPACVAEAPEEDRRGTLQMPLVATGTSGALYHLSGLFVISGPESQTITADGTQTSMQRDLQIGGYVIELLGGFQVSRIDGGMFVPVQATLLSPSVQSFTILENATTEVVFSFQTQGDVVQIGRGTLVVGINVEDQSHEVTCSDGLDNDGDGLIDCSDPECAQSPACSMPQEICLDGLDNDGDGLVDCSDPECAGAPGCSPPQFIITEMMRSGGNSPDPDGEWFEVRNVGGAPLPLTNCDVRSPTGIAPLSSGPAVPPGGYALIGHFPDPARYGGVFPAAIYPPNIVLLDSSGFIELRCGGLMMDHVDYGMGSGFPPFAPGRSIQLDPDVLNPGQNDNGATWCSVMFPFPTPTGTQFGTPGAPNEQCF